MIRRLAAAALLLLTIDRDPEPLIDRVDLIERNRILDPQTGRARLDQIIYWAWDDATHGHRVTAWRRATSPEALLIRTPDGCWRERWTDGTHRREIVARSYRETWTETDPELADRQTLPPEYRRGLKRPTSPLEP